MKLVAISDLHFDAHTAGVERFDEARTALCVAADHAIAIHASAFIFPGDACNPDDVGECLRAIDAMFSVARKLQHHGIESHWIDGNHDVIEGSDHTTLSLLRHAGEDVYVHSKPSVVEIFGDRVLSDDSHSTHRLVMLPYTPTNRAYSPDKFIRSLPRSQPSTQDCDIVIGHLMLEDIGPGSETTDMARGRDVFWPLDAIAECLPGALLIGGHYHRRQTYRGVNIVGAASRNTFGEADHEPAFMVIEV